MLFVFVCIYSRVQHVLTVSYSEGVVQEVGTAYHSRTPGLISGFWCGRVAYFIFCVMFLCFVFLRPVY